MKLNRVILGFMVLSSFSLHANVEARSFNNFSNLSDKAQLKYDRSYKAQFKLIADKGSRCTGTFISNEGHGLTAAHCVQSCMPISGLDGVKKWPVPVRVNGKKSRHAVSAYKWNYPQKCKAIIDGVEKEIEILSGPKGMLNNKVPYDIIRHFRQYFDLTSEETKAYKSLWLEAFKNDWGFGADFAIFKVLKSERTNCLRVSERRVFKGSHYTLSYPGKTSVSDKEINESLYLSTGIVYQADYFNTPFMVLNDKSYRYLNTSLEAYPGSSGAGLVNSENDEISGVLSMTAGGPGPDGEDQGVSARFVSAKKMREVAKDVLSKIRCSN